MPTKTYGALSSSADPSQLSLTVTSFTQVLIGVAAIYATSKGLDVASATSQVQAIVDVAGQVFTLAFTLYHSMMTCYGLVRKGIVFFATKPQA
jgi:hypothetical protein